MKKIGMFLAASLLFLNTAHGNAESCCSATKDAQESTCVLNCECTQAFLQGCAAGAAAGFTLEFFKDSFKQVLGENFCANTGICRDQLLGEAKVSTAALGLAAWNMENFSKFKKVGSLLAGVIVGACTASYLTKLLAPAATPSDTTTPA